MHYMRDYAPGPLEPPQGSCKRARGESLQRQPECARRETAGAERGINLVHSGPGLVYRPRIGPRLAFADAVQPEREREWKQLPAGMEVKRHKCGRAAAAADLECIRVQSDPVVLASPGLDDTQVLTPVR